MLVQCLSVILNYIKVTCLILANQEGFGSIGTRGLRLTGLGIHNKVSDYKGLLEAAEIALLFDVMMEHVE